MKERFIAAVLSVGLVALIFITVSCSHEFNNVTDPLSTDYYQGFETISNPDDIKPVVDDEVEYFISLTVSEVVGAEAYKIEIATDSGFTDIIYSADDFSSHILSIDANLTAEVTYYWRVSAYKDGDWGGVRSITPHPFRCNKRNQPDKRWFNN